jgi:hypothetical protein
MTGTLGVGSMLAGTVLLFGAEHWLPALAVKMGSLGDYTAALPGLLVLLGTALLGFALIRMQDG